MKNVSLELTAGELQAVLEGLRALDASMLSRMEALQEEGREDHAIDLANDVTRVRGLHEALVQEGTRVFGADKEAELRGSSLGGLQLVTDG